MGTEEELVLSTKSDFAVNGQEVDFGTFCGKFYLKSAWSKVFPNNISICLFIKFISPSISRAQLLLGVIFDLSWKKVTRWLCFTTSNFLSCKGCFAEEDW